MQTIYKGIENLKALLNDKYFLVADSSYDFINIKEYIESLNIEHYTFKEFSPNPLHDDVDKGREIFQNGNYQTIIAVGGGSAMDVAKCIKLDSNSKAEIIAIPTTAGTGAESTRHIVVYRNGAKESLGNETIVPNKVILEPSVLKSLPLYQKKCTLLDALCQAIESYWNVNATAESRELSKKAIKSIMQNKDAYIIENNENSFLPIMEASNYAGQAINITATTAAHAMSYKITSKYQVPHGGAVGMLLPEVFEAMLDKADEELSNTFNEISGIMGYESPQIAIKEFKKMLQDFELKYPESENYELDLQELAASVNPIRLKNNPIQFNEEELKEIYTKVLRRKNND